MKIYTKVIAAFLALLILFFGVIHLWAEEEFPPIPIPENTRFLFGVNFPKLSQNTLILHYSKPVMAFLSDYIKIIPDNDDFMMLFDKSLKSCQLERTDFSHLYFVAPSQMKEGVSLLYSHATLIQLQKFCESLIRLQNKKYIFSEIEIDSQKAFQMDYIKGKIYWIEHAPSVYVIAKNLAHYRAYRSAQMVKEKGGILKLLPKHFSTAPVWFSWKKQFAEVTSGNGTIQSSDSALDVTVTLITASKENGKELYQRLRGQFMFALVALSGKHPDIAQAFQQNTVISQEDNNVVGTMNINTLMIDKVLKALPPFLPK